jgi:hypothetical protein
MSGIATASGGLEVLDEKNEGGVQLAVRGDNQLAWRAIRSVGNYGEWNKIDLQIQSVVAKVAIEYENGRVKAFMPDDRLRKYPLGDVDMSSSAMLTIGIWAAAEPGTDFKIAAESMQIQLKPVGAPSTQGRFEQ